MNRRLVIDLPAWQVAVAAGTAIICAAVVGAGLAWGGVEYGRATAPAPTSTERVYTAADLTTAAEACGAPATVVAGSTLTMPGGEHAPYTRACVVAELEAPARARAEYGYLEAGARPEFVIHGGTYTWSNATMTWTQTAEGRDLTITIQEA